jgi:hypothetical protein
VNSARDKPQPTMIERKHQELSSLLPVQVSEPKSAMHSDLKSLQQKIMDLESKL